MQMSAGLTSTRPLLFALEVCQKLHVACQKPTYYIAAALVCKNQLAQVGPDFDKFRACVTQINMQALLCACVYMTIYIYIFSDSPC